MQALSALQPVWAKRYPWTKKLGEVELLHSVVETHRVTEVIITDETIDKKSLIELLEYCASRRVNVWFPPAYLAFISVKLVTHQF